MERVDFGKAKWIWTKDNTSPDQKVVIRKRICLEQVPQVVEAYISCETKFWLWVNSVPVVYEGGIFRESFPGCGYAERVDITPYLKAGDNTIAILVWYYGNGGRNNVRCSEAGLILSCPELDLYSNSSFRICRHPAYSETCEPYPSYLYGGYNIGFNANWDFGDFTVADFDDTSFENATEYPNLHWGDCVLSPLPLLRTYEKKVAGYRRTTEGASARLPYAMTCSVGFVLDAAGGEVIDIRTDRYIINGGPGDSHHCYKGHRVEYVAKAGRNEFVSPMYLYGEELVLSFPDSVTLHELSYIESGYDTELIGSFQTDDALFNRLIQKAIRTLYVCMRNNFMDCPDRERGQWIGDVSVQAPQVFFVCDDNGKFLLKKAISDFIHLRKGDVLLGNVPGEHACELPGQSLVAISKFGLIGEYYQYTHDQEVLKYSFEPIVRYLQLWQMEDGTLVPRSGDWRWFDHLYNVDETVLEHGLYLAALKYALEIAYILDRHEFDGFLNERIAAVTTRMESYWQGEYYASGTTVDDRANAVAVLCGACPPSRYPAVRQLLLSVQHATPYFERFILKALCEMGYVEDAYRRMMSRYYNLTVNNNTTLWEDFYILGTRNHAWSGAPLEIAFRYLLGIDTIDGFKSYSISPVAGVFNNIKCTLPISGRLIEITVTNDNGRMVVAEEVITSENIYRYR